MIMLKQFLCQLFSAQCQLTYLRLDISNELTNGRTHTCLSLNPYSSPNSIQYKIPSFCVTLRCLQIRLKYICFLENLIEHVPNIEQISVQLHSSLDYRFLRQLHVETLNQSNRNWFNKDNRIFFVGTKATIF